MGLQSTTCALAAPPPLRRNCTGMPGSSLVGENMAQPCALTTNVSHISENGALGSRLVTAMGRVIGTLELRRIVSATFALCMVSLFHGCPASWFCDFSFLRFLVPRFLV